MTPKARRQLQLNRESASRGDTEAAIEEFRAGRRVHEPTVLGSKRKARKNSARCAGCDTTGFPLEVWEYHDVISGPSILCNACASIAESRVRAAGRSGAPRPAFGGESRKRRV